MKRKTLPKIREYKITLRFSLDPELVDDHADPDASLQDIVHEILTDDPLEYILISDVEIEPVKH